MKAIGVVAGLGALSLAAIGVKKCHARMQEHCGGGQTAACAGRCQDAKTDPGETGQTTACTEACAEG